MNNPATVEEQQSLRDEIREFFEKAASRSSTKPQYCKTCGHKMKYLRTTFYLYGTDSSWSLSLPACKCGAKSWPLTD